jgi:hypothetical protein
VRRDLSPIAEDLLAQLAVYSGPLPVFTFERPIATQLVDAGLAEWTPNNRRLEATEAGRAHHALVLRRKGIG